MPIPSDAKVRRDFKIIEENGEFIVVDKPSLLLIHPTKPDATPTLWRELRELLAFEIANGARISIINRLDRETSGLVLVAKNQAAARRFGLLIQSRRALKEYTAIVHGWPKWDQKIVDAALVRQGEIGPTDVYLQRSVDSSGSEAITEFNVIRRFSKRTTNGTEFALIQARPVTGRTHQIRVHLAFTGHPIVGDKIYGVRQHYLRFIETGWTPELERDLLLERHALHSSRLRFDEKHDWASSLPIDLAQFCGQE